ncbi:hypothetical protein C8R43DRAFT_942388 [Mycena crocata]|nr:hypothetical protein C8R43DRAFT_942388 [Mycena crocata]
MHKATKPEFSDSIRAFRNGQYINQQRKIPSRLMTTTGDIFYSRAFTEAVRKHSAALNDAIVHLRDYDLPYALATYELLSSRQISLDEITSLHAGTAGKLQTSTFSMSLSNAPVLDMYEAIVKCAIAARDGAKVGIAAQGVPCSGRVGPCIHDKVDIGIWPLMRFLEAAVSFGKRPQQECTDMVNVTIEPWHKDARACIEFNNVHQNDLSDQRSVTATMGIPDIFMGRVDDDADWSMFCPRDVPDLLKLTGQEFDEAYTRYEESNTPRTTMKAKELWYMILRSMILTGGPAIVFKDNLNGKNNVTDAPPSCYSNLRTGVIDMLGDDDDLYPRIHAAIHLPLFLSRGAKFDFNRLHQVTKETVYILNKAMDASLPDLITMVDRNVDFRAIAIGQNGLADVFVAMKIPYESLEAAELNVNIAETIYHGALEASCELAERDGAYEHFQGSPLAQGIMQYHFWDAKPSDAYDWALLNHRIQRSGVRNATLIAIGPGEAGTKHLDSFPQQTQCQGKLSVLKTPTRAKANPCALNSNIIEGSRISPWLVQELTNIGLWDMNMCDDIVTAKGSS